MLQAAVADLQHNYNLGLQKCKDIVEYLQSLKKMKYSSIEDPTHTLSFGSNETYKRIS